MTGRKRQTSIIGVFIAVLALLTVVPWLVEAVFAPLQPPELAVTATQYVDMAATFDQERRQQEMQATSAMIFETPLPDDADRSFNSSDTSLSKPAALRLQRARAQANTIEAYSPDALIVYTCPSYEYRIDRIIRPYEHFSILGWNENEQENHVVFFLIKDDLNGVQEWIENLDSTIFVETVHYRDVFPEETLCRPYPREGDPVTAAASPTFALPRALTATPLPLLPAKVEITDAEAVTQLSELSDEIRNPSVSFTEDGINITGEITINLPIIGASLVPFEVFGNFEVRDEKLYLVVESLTANGLDRTGTDDRRMLENSINNWLLQTMIGRQVQSFVLSAGRIIVDVLERQQEVLPETTAPLPTATPLNAENAQPTATLMLPRALTVTPLPPQPATVSLSGDDSAFALQSVGSDLANVDVEFSSDGSIHISAQMPLGEALGRQVMADLDVTGHFDVQGQELVFLIDALSVNNADLSDSVARERLEYAINNWLQQLMVRRMVQAFHFEDGNLIIDVLESR